MLAALGRLSIRKGGRGGLIRGCVTLQQRPADNALRRDGSGRGLKAYRNGRGGDRVHHEGGKILLSRNEVWARVVSNVAGGLLASLSLLLLGRGATRLFKATKGKRPDGEGGMGLVGLAHRRAAEGGNDGRGGGITSSSRRRRGGPILLLILVRFEELLPADVHFAGEGVSRHANCCCLRIERDRPDNVAVGVRESVHTEAFGGAGA